MQQCLCSIRLLPVCLQSSACELLFHCQEPWLVSVCYVHADLRTKPVLELQHLPLKGHTTHSLHQSRLSTAVHQTSRSKSRLCVRSSMPEAGGKLRILALHSWRTSGSIFIEQVRAVLHGYDKGSSRLTA